MANITGTEGKDTLRGTNRNTDPQSTEGNDIINALGGNDRIIASTGKDQIDGGNGYDVLDFSNVNENIALSIKGDFISNDEQRSFVPGSSNDADLINASAFSIEKIVGNPNRINRIGNAYKQFATFPEDFSFGSNSLERVDIDLLKNQLIYSGGRTIRIENFDNVTLPDKIVGSVAGNNRDNTIIGGRFKNGELSIIGSRGNDTLSGTASSPFINTKETGTLDYSNLGRSINFILNPKAYSSRRQIKTDIRGEIVYKASVDKGDFGKDSAINFIKVIGATNKSNTLDVSTVGDFEAGFNSGSEIKDGLSIDLNLTTNSLNINVIDPRNNQNINRQLEVVNFVNALGTKNNDTIVGANKKGKLTGGGGNDTITGGNKNDIITGSDSTAKGVGEVDILTGGGGRDKFVLGDKNGAYYVGKGKDDYATITDFNLFQDSINLGGFKDYSFASGGNNTIELYSGKDVNTRDLIAKIQLTGGISNRSTNSRSVMGADASLNAITSKIDILSGVISND